MCHRKSGTDGNSHQQNHEQSDTVVAQHNYILTQQEITALARRVGPSEVEEGGIQGYEDVLLYKRNKNWIPIMGDKMTKGQVFFAVGAGHLGGKDGVIDLLKKEGYKLTPLSTTE